MAGIKPEFDIVHPRAELKMLTSVMRGATKALEDANKELLALDNAPTYGLEIVLRDAEGELVPVKGADGELYDAMVFEGVTGANVRSVLANAGIGLHAVLPDELNLRQRVGGRVITLTKQLKDYSERKAKAMNMLDVLKARGEV